jgi:iron complex outermembrane recepter protein
VGKGLVLPITGKSFPLAPEVMLGYAFGQVKLLGIQNLQLSGNISNIVNRQYLNPSAGSIVNNAQAVHGDATSGTVFFYLGSPRLASITLSGEFCPCRD